MSQTNFLIGRGELLTSDIKGPKRKPGKAEVYTFQEAVRRLTPQFLETAAALDTLPPDACPGDFGVARLTMNPSYVARSFFPAAMLRTVGLESLGSRTVKLMPDGWTKKGAPQECTTTELFVAGKRQAFRNLNSWPQQFEPESSEALDLAHIERFSTFAPEQRIATYGSKKDQFFEVGIHLLPDGSRQFVQQAFAKYAQGVEVKVHSDLGFTAGNLWFVPVEGKHNNIKQLAKFVFVRVIRPMPKLRSMRPVLRTGEVTVSCSLPTEQPLSSEPKVAILDGGLPKHHTIGSWLRSYRLLDEGAADDADGLTHGLAVTSAFLFGPIQPGGTGNRPFAYVDHLRVFDKDAETEDPLELYRTLGVDFHSILTRAFHPNLARLSAS